MKTSLLHSASVIYWRMAILLLKVIPSGHLLCRPYLHLAEFVCWSIYILAAR